MPDRHLKLWIDRNKPKNIPARHSNPNSPLPRPAYVAPDNSQRNHHHHQNFPGGRQLQPWSSTEEDDPTNHLPSDSERTESTTTETEEDDDGDDLFVEAQRRQVEQSWSTTQQGTDALQALFFGETDGGDVTLRHDPAVLHDSAPLAPPPPLHAFTLGHAPSSEQPVRPLAVAAAPSQSSQLSTPNSTHSHSTLHATPPQVAYERQQSFVQPKPKQSQNQQTRLLDLLTGSAATPPPPSLPLAEGQGQGQSQSQQAGPMTVAALEQQVNFARGALGTLTLDTPSPLAQQLPLPAHLPVSASNSVYSSHQPSPAPHAPAPAPVFVSDLEDSQKQEKRDALLRALLSVAAKSPPKPPPQELEPHAQDARWFASPPLQPAIQPPPPSASNMHNNNIGGGSLLSILNGNDRMSAAAVPAYGHSPQPAPQHAMTLPHPGLPPSVAMSNGLSYPSPQQYPPPSAAAYGPHAQQQQQQQPSPHMHVSGPPMVPMPPYPNQPQQYQPQQYAQPPYHQPPPSFPSHHLPGPAGPSSSSQQPSIPPHVHQSSYASNNNHSTMSQQPYATGPAQHGPLPPMPPPVPIVPPTGGPGGPAGVQQPQARVHPGHLLGLLNGRS